MASKKDKILESAQRFVLKGQIDKAIKEYQQVVAMEPGDLRSRQRLAELLVRDNRKDEASQQYEDIGKHYADNGYFLKAIATYKQIQRLNPGNLSTALTIAHLNHQQGLIGNAMAEYGQVVAHYEREGDLKEALKVVEKMVGVDADHAATKLKYAELLYATGAQEQSREAFAALEAGLRSRGLTGEAASVVARARELFPQQEAVEPPVSLENEGLSVNGFDAGDEVPGVAAAPWEAPIEEPALPDWDAPAAELPDPFAAPATPQAELAEPAEPAAAATAPASYEAPAPWDTEQEDAESAGSIAWEEEIDLDLDDDGFQAAPAPEPFAVSEEPQAPPEPAAAPAAEVELPLDFSLELNFDEVDQELEEAEPEQVPVVELDLEQGGELELTLPDQEAPFGELSWEEEGEQELPQEPEVPEQAEELAELEEVELELEPFAEPELELVSEQEPLEEQEPEALAPPEPVRQRGWEEIFPNAAAGEADLDLEELESHYDLGIGYKEMGMYAGAIKEFDIAAANPQRRFDCLTLQAICYRDKGEPAKAEELLRRGLDLDVISKDERTCLNYELGVLAEARGAADEAIEMYREVIRANPAYQDASNRLSTLSGEEIPDIIDLELEEGS
ncbi:tetratricopeptide repeat protein [Geomonas oryzisoli]|uniref:Tetratricopeptide repeat protein n=1 Tax=Geomonas oryzisoli TaxID=2847992 RepID=A0ABX8J9J2_9BACT|nr:tetratricopeptide repeat protein [Geomonas oryzisoli]QWV92220.1 tetratricopeptide repeat protein [Geomonas oryzisoli]